jgi:hypothetical protein
VVTGVPYVIGFVVVFWGTGVNANGTVEVGLGGAGVRVNGTVDAPPVGVGAGLVSVGAGLDDVEPSGTIGSGSLLYFQYAIAKIIIIIHMMNIPSSNFISKLIFQRI